MKICLFNWNSEGHHDLHAHAFAEALAPVAEVTVAGPDPLLERLGDLPVRRYSLGDSRPRMDSADNNKSALARQEIELLRTAIQASDADHALVLYADPIMRWLAWTKRFKAQLSVFVMFSQAHFPKAYGLPLSRRERLRAEFKEAIIQRWRLRRDSHVIFGLDEAAVAKWRRAPGAQPIWLPEPPIDFKPQPVAPAEREGALLFGYMDERKGIDRLATALSNGAEGTRIALAGDVAPEYRNKLLTHIETMRRGGAVVDADLRRLAYSEAMSRLAASRCSLLSFGWRPSGSRVLVEAANVRTPVIVSDRSAVGSLVTKHGLGLAVDPTDPSAIRKAIQRFSNDPWIGPEFEAGLQTFAEEIHGTRFASTVRKAFGLA